MDYKVFEPEFCGKVVLITGGSGQIGLSIISHYLEAGACVVNLDIKEPSLPWNNLATKDLVFGRLYFISCDVRMRASVDEAIALISRTAGRVDILINCAGISVFTPFEERSDEEFSRVVDVNLKGTFLVTQAVSQLMLKQKNKGVILNIGSIYGVSVADQRIYGDSGRNSPEVYAATKAGVIQFARYLARYFGKDGIRVNCVSPGGIFSNQGEPFVSNYKYKTPLGRMGEPEDLIGGVFYLTSSMSKYVTGQNLLIDGGFTIGD